MEFKQNNEYTIEPTPLVTEENVFLKKEVEDTPLPTFEENRHRLPVPIWDGHADVLACYERTWELAFANLRSPAPGSGFVSNYIDTAFNGCMFMWDSVFILMFGRYADRIFNFQGTLDNFYSHQHKDGFICREIDGKTGHETFARRDPASTGPDVLAWSEWEYYLNFGDKERLAAVFPPLMAYHRWMAENHTWRDGTYFSTGWGSGMDNSPRLEQGRNVHFSHGHMVWVDACMQELNNCNILIKMARITGREEFIPELEAERDILENVINEKLWDEKTGFYYDEWRGGRLNMVKHAGAFWALLAKCASPERAERLIAHLENENEFASAMPVPTLSRYHAEYRPDGGYWRGGVWAPTNYMILKGLDAYGRYDLSHKIGRKYLEGVVSVFNETNTVFENYAPETVDGRICKGNPAKPDFVGWTGIPPIAVLFEYVFGIKPDAANGRITWHINLTERHGVEKYPFGTDGELTLICEQRMDASEKPCVTFESNVPVTLEIIWGEGEEKRSVTECK